MDTVPALAPSVSCASSSDRVHLPSMDLQAKQLEPTPSGKEIPSLSATNPINGSISSTSDTSIDIQPKIKILKPLPVKHSKATTDAAVKEAKAEIRSKLREDWEYPVPGHVPLSLRLDEGAVRWVERESDEEFEPPRPGDPNAHLVADAIEFRARAWSNPDPFGHGRNLESTVSALNPRKRKQRDLIVAETEINEGLRLFVKRRDAWTGAQARNAVTTNMSPPPTAPPHLPPSPSLDILQPPDDRSLSTSSSASSAGIGTSISVSPALTTDTTPPPAFASPFTPSSTSAIPSQPFITVSNTSTNPSSTIATDILIPHPPPLLPTSNPVRASITPSTYSSLYTKIAIQGLTPTIPVNLADMTAALVRGWKKDGEWPPQGLGDGRGEGPFDFRARGAFGEGGRGRGRSFGSGRAFGNGQAFGGGYALGSGHAISEGGRKAVRRSVGKVKKVLGIGETAEEEGEREREEGGQRPGDDKVKVDCEGEGVAQGTTTTRVGEEGLAAG